MLCDVNEYNDMQKPLACISRRRFLFYHINYVASFIILKSLLAGLTQSGKRDSNPRPSAWEANALPTELLPLE